MFFWGKFYLYCGWCLLQINTKLRYYVSLLPSIQRVSVAREEWLKEGQSTRASPAAAGGGGGGRGVSQEEVATKVKAIMNQAYQTLAAKYRAKETFQSKEILAILVAAIKVDVCVCECVCVCVCMCVYLCMLYT